MSAPEQDEGPGGRLRRLREAKRMSKRQVARHSGGAFTDSYVGKLESGASSWSAIGTRVAQGFARAFDMSVDEVMAVVSGRTDLTAKAEEDVLGRRVPVYRMGGSAAFEPTHPGGAIMHYTSVPAHWVGDYIGYLVDCDAMAPRIPVGATIIVKKQTNADDGQAIVAFAPGHGVLLRRHYHNHPGSVLLTGDNPNVPPLVLNDARVIGTIEEVRIPNP